ncbi:MAG: transposase, partial [Akkermansia sp.]|nr:transposase [Akkermansia sp.]
KTLSRHAQQVLNFFRYRLTSGRIEGINSMIARIQLKTRGLPSVDYLRLKLRQLTISVIHATFLTQCPFYENLGSSL